MSTPKPPFHSVTEELLFNILQKLPDVQYLTADAIDSVAKLNALVLDGDFPTTGSMSSALADTIANIKGNVPATGDTLEKIYNIISGLGNLKSEDIDTLSEINALLTDADLVSTSQLTSAVSSLWGANGNAFGSLKKFGNTDNFPVAFVTNNIERARLAEQGQLLLGTTALLPGYEVYRLQVKDENALAASGNSFFENGNFSINLGKLGSPTLHQFRINTFVGSYGGVDFIMSATNVNASIEITDYQFGGVRPELIRITPSGYANTGIMMFPNIYNTAYGYRYLLQATNTSQQSRNVAAFHAQIDFPIDDAYPQDNQTELFAAQSLVTNHKIDGFFANVSSLNPAAEAYGFRSKGTKNFLDGDGMIHFQPVLKITTDTTPDPTGLAGLLNGDPVLGSAMMLSARAGGRSSLIISPGHVGALGLFIGPQQALSTGHYDGYLAWIQFSTGGANMTGNTDKSMLLIRKHNSILNGFDHSGPFIRLEENINSTGSFIEAFKYNTGSSSLRLKFSVDKDGVISIGQLATDPINIPGVGRIYFVGENLKLVTPNGIIKTVTVS
jgi:hypothetical protein